MKVLVRAFIVLLGFGIVVSTPATAWESDVHYGLTKWLALQAGYTEQQATWIAEGNLGIDSSSVTEPVYTTIRSACIGKDDTGSREVHDHHFPSEHSAPNPAEKRSVTPGYVQKGGSQQHPPKITNYNDEARFKELGAYLHAFQDTWSHQGVPDFPQPPCDPRLGWGHAFARGGWPCHLADLTHVWRNTDFPAMARATYQLLLDQKPGSAKYWEELLPKLEAFAAARSKWQKDEWFNQESFNDRSFLEDISLPDCEPGVGPCPGPYPFKSLIETWARLVARYSQASSGLSDLPPDILQLFQDVLSGMVGQGKALPTSLIDRTLAERAVRRAFRVNTMCPAFYDAITPYMLEQGFAKGRVTPTALCELAAQVAKGGSNEISCDQAASAVIKGLVEPPGANLQVISEVARSLGLPVFLFTAGFHAASENYVAFARFVHLPHDTLLLSARRLAGTPRIVGVVWMPDQ